MNHTITRTSEPAGQVVTRSCGWVRFDRSETVVKGFARDHLSVHEKRDAK